MRNLKQITSIFALLISTLLFIACSDSSSQQSTTQNGKIAFTSDMNGSFEVYSMNPDGSNITQLTFNNGVSAHPSWSFDGNKIVFTGIINGTYDIYMMNQDGSNQTKLTNNQEVNMVPAFSPDGTKVVFESNRTGNYEIFSMDTNGGNQQRLTYTNCDNYGAKFSPNGLLIAFASNCDSNQSGVNNIFLMNADGANKKQLTTNMNNALSRAWSPDSTKIVFNNSENGVGQLYIVDVATGAYSRLTNNDGSHAAFNPGGVFPSIQGDVTPAWSPDGKLIAFASDRAGNYEIFTVNADGSNIVQLTKVKAHSLTISWQNKL
jgi:TolB protein